MTVFGITKTNVRVSINELTNNRMLCTDFGLIYKPFIESLILAQDERWRRA